MHPKTRIILCVLLLLASFGVAWAQPPDANTFVWGIGLDIGTFNTVLQDTGISLIAETFLFPALFEIDANSGVPILGSGLTTWEVSDDGLTYTFAINDAATWSDGTPITSQDVKFTFGAIGAQGVETWRQPFDGAINIIDDKTFELVMNTNDCSIWSALGQTRIMPAHKFAPDYSDFMTNSLNTAPDISGGPYLLDEWSPDEFVRFTANPDYWGGAPKIQTMILRVIPDSAAMKQALIAGEIDRMEGLSPDDVEELQAYDNVVTYTFPTNAWWIVALNNANPANPQPAIDDSGNRVEQEPHPIFGDARVRRALIMGWNHDDALALAGPGAQRVIGPVMPSVPWAYDNDLQPYPYDPDAAAALLDEAGWMMNTQTGVREKDGHPLEFQLDVTPAFVDSDAVALIMQDQLADIGFKVNIETWEPNALLPRVFGQQYDAWIAKLDAGQPDPQVLTQWLVYGPSDKPGGLNIASFSTPELDALIEQAGSMPGCAPEDRAPLYYRIQEIVHENAPYDSIRDHTTSSAVSARLGNYEPGPWGDGTPVTAWTLNP